MFTLIVHAFATCEIRITYSWTLLDAVSPACSSLVRRQILLSIELELCTLLIYLRAIEPQGTFETRMITCLFGVSEIIWGLMFLICHCQYHFRNLKEFVLQVDSWLFGVLKNLVWLFWGLRKLLDMTTPVPKIKEFTPENWTGQRNSLCEQYYFSDLTFRWADSSV